MKKNYLVFTILIGVLALISRIHAQTILPAVVSSNKTLTTAESPYIGNTNIIVGKGVTLKAEPGVEIKMAEATHLIVKGKLEFVGTEKAPIHIHAIDTIWGNIYFDSTLTVKSILQHVIIENARHNLKITSEPGAVFGYFSTLEMNNCTFKDNLKCFVGYQSKNVVMKNSVLDSTNQGEKILCQYCDNAVIDNNTLYFTAGDCDAIDFDASKEVTISNNRLYGGEDDGIDIGQCDSVGCDGVLITGNHIVGYKNKGVSNGEKCINIKVERNLIAACDLGIGAKSGAYITADHNTLYGNRMGIKSYHHLHQTWGPGHLTVTNSIIYGSVDSTWVKDPTADLDVSYSIYSASASDLKPIPGSNNTMTDPMFVSPTLDLSGNFNLKPGSPAIDEGDPSAPKDLDMTRSDIGAFYFNQATIGVNELEKEEIAIFPNPASSTIDLNTKDFTGHNFRLCIYDIHGKRIYYDSQLKKQLNLSVLPAGIYYLELSGDNKLQRATIIKN